MAASMVNNPAVPQARTRTAPVGKPANSPWAEPGAAGENLALADFPTFLFYRISGAMQRDVTSLYLADARLNVSQWRVLAALAMYTPIPFSGLVRRSYSDKALVSRSLQLLERRELAAVEPDPEHGKRLICRITPKGRALYRKLLPKARAAQADVLRLLNREERVALHAALVKLRAALDVRT